METNIIYSWDNLEVLPEHIPHNIVDLVYIDPPFNDCKRQTAHSTPANAPSTSVV